MLFEEWDWEKYGAVQRQEGLEEGLEKGMTQMLSQIIHTLAESAKVEDIASMLKIPISQVQTILQPSAS